MTITIPNTRPERWPWLREQIAEWSAPLQDDDGYDSKSLDQAEQRLGVKIPLGLREWYQMAGKRWDVWSRQDQFEPPDQLQIGYDESRDAEFLIFYRENQDVVQWGIRREDCTMEDPPVYLLDWSQSNDTMPGAEAGSTSEFALAMFCYQLCAAGAGPYYSGYAQVDERAASAIRQLPALFSPLHWPTENARLFAYENAYVFCASQGGDTQINMGAKDKSLLTNFSAQMGFKWTGILLPGGEEEE